MLDLLNQQKTIDRFFRKQARKEKERIYQRKKYRKNKKQVLAKRREYYANLSPEQKQAYIQRSIENRSKRCK